MVLIEQGQVGKAFGHKRRLWRGRGLLQHGNHTQHEGANAGRHAALRHGAEGRSVDDRPNGGSNTSKGRRPRPGWPSTWPAACGSPRSRHGRPIPENYRPAETIHPGYQPRGPPPRRRRNKPRPPHFLQPLQRHDRAHRQATSRILAACRRYRHPIRPPTVARRRRPRRMIVRTEGRPCRLSIGRTLAGRPPSLTRHRHAATEFVLTRIIHGLRFLTQSAKHYPKRKRG